MECKAISVWGRKGYHKERRQGLKEGWAENRSVVCHSIWAVCFMLQLVVFNGWILHMKSISELENQCIELILFQISTEAVL